MFNVTFVEKLVSKLVEDGVLEWVVCSGSRNAPFVKVLAEAKGLTVHWFFEERSAAYFALGRSLKTDRPVAVCTTSGTAVANLIPAAMESYYRESPLVFVTADRPKSYRGSGAPQSVEQVGMFGQYTDETIDISPFDDLPNAFVRNQRSAHVNVCLDEPLLDKKPTTLDFRNWDSFIKTEDIVETKVDWSVVGERPLIVVSHMTKKEAELVKPLLAKVEAPLYVECGSQLKPYEREWKHAIRGGEKAVQHFYRVGLIDSVIRLGGVPTLRFWRDLDAHDVPVLNFSSQRFTGLPEEEVETENIELDDESSASAVHDLELFDVKKVQHDELNSLMDIDGSLANMKSTGIKNFPNSELAHLQKLVSMFEESDQVFVGNSLPIREMDLLDWSDTDKSVNVLTQRGVNGIDGLVSVALGQVEPKSRNWIILGDLTTMYDLQGFWPLKDMPKEDVKFVVINNGGGKIFNQIYDDPLFENRHGFNFSGLADMWGMKYRKVQSSEDWNGLKKGPELIELLPEIRESKDLWKAIHQISQ